MVRPAVPTVPWMPGAAVPGPTGPQDALGSRRRHSCLPWRVWRTPASRCSGLCRVTKPMSGRLHGCATGTARQSNRVSALWARTCACKSTKATEPSASGRPSTMGRVPAPACGESTAAPGGTALPVAVQHSHACAAGRLVAFRADWLPFLPVLTYVARFLGSRFYGVAFSPLFTCNNGGALFVLGDLGIQKPCNIGYFCQISTANCMKREAHGTRAPRRAGSRNGAPDWPGRHGADHRRRSTRRSHPSAGGARQAARATSCVCPFFRQPAASTTSPKSGGRSHSKAYVIHGSPMLDSSNSFAPTQTMDTVPSSSQPPL